MARFQAASLLACACALGAAVTATADVPADVESLESQVLAYRRESTQRCRVLLEARYEGPGAEEDNKRLFVCDGKDSRIVAWQPGKGGAWNQEAHFILSPDHYIEDRGPEDCVYAAPNADYPDVRDHFRMYHPRDIGMDVNTLSSLVAHGMTFLVGRADVAASTLRTERVQGTDLLRIDKELLSGMKATIWIDPAKGPSIVRAETHVTTSSEPRQQLDYSADIRLKQYGEVWYPERIDQEGRINGKRYVREQVRILEAAFGQAIDPREFAFAGMGLPVGKEIEDRRAGDKKYLVWDGRQALDREEVGKAPLLSAAWRRTWLACGVVFLALGVGYVFLAWRRNS